MTRLRPLLLALGALALLDCATLDPLIGGTCGNGVVDANEDCDRLAPAHFSQGQCGASGEGASACRLKCARSADCPDGWGCSVSGTCRAPSATFARLGDAASAGVDTMVVGDLDGDRRTDIIASGPSGATGTGKVRVHYFGDEAVLAHVNTLGAPISSPAVHDFDQDGIDDFAFGLDIGAFGIMTGQLDRSLVPAIFPSYRSARVEAKPVIAFERGRPIPGGGTSAFFLAGTFADDGGRIVHGLVSTGGGYGHVLPVGTREIVGEPVWGPLLADDPASTCGEIAIAMKAEGPNGTIQVFSPCRPLAGTLGAEWDSERAPRTIDPPAPLDGGLHVVDADGDGRLDLLFGVKSASGQKTVFLARSTGTAFLEPIATAFEELPIASKDVDGDGRVDFVLPTGIALSNAGAVPADAGVVDGGPPPPAGTPFRDYLQFDLGRLVRWTSARIGDFNGDKLPDIVACSDQQPDIDFFGAVRLGAFVSATISTAGPVTRLAVDDFDGDTIQDIGFVQKRPGQTDITDVAIAYGRPVGPPETPRIVGRTTSVVSLTPLGDPADPSGVARGLALFVEEKAKDDGLPDLAFAFILGNADRQPIAPLLIGDPLGKGDRDPDVTREWVPFEVHAAPVAAPDRADLVAFSVGYRYSRSRQRLADGPHPAGVWVAKGTGGTTFATPQLMHTIGTFEFGSDGRIALHGGTAVGDVDNPPDGLADFVALHTPANAGKLVLQIARKDQLTEPIEIPGESIQRAAPMALHDVDGDGHLDLVARLGGAGAGTVAVFYNDAAGGFVLPAATVLLADDEDARGFAWIATAGAPAHQAGGARRELAILTSRRVVLASPEGADRTQFAVREAGGGSGPFIEPTAIAAGDFDGDGAADLAIADGGALRILRQLPR